MEDPVFEICDVVRSLVEPYEASVIAQNVEKYFTEDAFLMHPAVNTPRGKYGRTLIKGLYKFLRIGTIKNRMIFHHVMFSEDKTHIAMDVTEELNFRYPLINVFRFAFPLSVRVDLVKEGDGKYRIWRQHDFAPHNLECGLLPLLFLFAPLINLLKIYCGVISGIFGKFCLDNNFFGK